MAAQSFCWRNIRMAPIQYLEIWSDENDSVFRRWGRREIETEITSHKMLTCWLVGSTLLCCSAHCLICYDRLIKTNMVFLLSISFWNQSTPNIQLVFIKKFSSQLSLDSEKLFTIYIIHKSLQNLDSNQSYPPKKLLLIFL